MKKFKPLALQTLSNLEKKLSENNDGRGYFVGDTVSLYDPKNSDGMEWVCG